MISTLSPIFRFRMELSLFSLKITKYDTMYCIHGVTCLRTIEWALSGSGLLDVMVGTRKTAGSQCSSRSRFRSGTSWWGLAVAPQGLWETRHQPHRGWEVWCHIKWHLMSKYGGTFVLMLLRTKQTKHYTNNSNWSFPFQGCCWSGQQEMRLLP